MLGETLFPYNTVGSSERNFDDDLGLNMRSDILDNEDFTDVMMPGIVKMSHYLDVERLNQKNMDELEAAWRQDELRRRDRGMSAIQTSEGIKIISSSDRGFVDQVSGRETDGDRIVEDALT